MKVKELESTVNVAWSPQNHHPVMLATGSAAQQVDASFSSSSSLEVYSLNLGDPGYELEQLVSVPTEHKFQKLVWSSSGILVGGCDGGLIQFYKVDDLLENKKALVSSNTKHTGSVSALDLNPFQKNLLCSGAADSEIFIWDLNITTTPMAPGNKVQPLEPVQGLAWNRQVQHILASAFTTRCVVWDLRKNEPIIKLWYNSDGSARTRWKSTVWHPSVATQLCIASEEDQNPVVQLWDLRLATSPVLTLEGHQKGVLALSWCQQDQDLLLSAAKDGRVICWNPNTNNGDEMLLEVCNTGQWMYDVSWCPKNPNLFHSCSNDGRVGIFSINGGTKHQQVATTNKIMDSFPGMESLQQAPVAVHSETEPVIQMLPRPPQWTRRPIRASFGFGGKLVTFDNHTATSQGQNGTTPQKEVFISQITTEPELIDRARVLQEVIGAAGSEGAAHLLAEHCIKRGDSASDQHEKYIWHFLKASFTNDPRSEMLNLLGFTIDDISTKLNDIVLKLKAKNNPNIDGHNNVDQLTDRMAGLSRSESSETEPEPSTDTSTDVSGLDGTAAFDTIAQNTKLSNEVKAPSKTFTIPTGDDSEGLICQALLSGNIEAAVEFCLDAGRTSDALVLASIGGGDLLHRTQLHYLSSSTGAIGKLASALVKGDWNGFANGTAPSAWKAAISAALASCNPEQLYEVCELLGEKLEKQNDPTLQREAVICYLCSASVEPLVSLWLQQLGSLKSDPSGLTHIVEMVLIARLAAIQRGRPVQSCGKLSNLLTSYAMKLASQGHLDGALNCLSGLQDQDLTYRLQCALGYAQPYSTRQSAQPRRSSALPQQQNQWSTNNRSRTSSYNHPGQPQDQWGAANVQSSLYNSGVDKPVMPPIPQPYAPQPPIQPLQPTPPVAQPPRPSSGSSQGGPVGRNKYLRDPSVQSGSPSYTLNPIDTQPGFGNRNTMQPSNPGFVGIQQQQMNPSAPQQHFPSQPAIFTPQPFINNNVPPLVPSVMNSASNYSAGAGGDVNQGTGYFQQPEMATDALQAKGLQSTPGWNDPPVFSNKKEMSAEHAGTRQWKQMILHSRAQHRTEEETKQKEFSAPPPPITHPLFGVAPEQPAIPVMSNAPPMYPQDNNMMYNYNAAPPSMPPTAMSYQSQMIPATVEPVPTPPPPTPVAPIQKLPIPEQHIHMQTVFDALRAQCTQTIGIPQYKRKLDDVQKKLEILYDFLRENKLSENALNTLHCVVQMVQGGDYAGALSTLTTLASGSDFAVVASFLPSLKVLIQTASNSQIYLK